MTHEKSATVPAGDGGRNGDALIWACQHLAPLPAAHIVRAKDVVKAASGVYEPKSVYNALTYLTRTGELRRAGYGQYEIVALRAASRLSQGTGVRDAQVLRLTEENEALTQNAESFLEIIDMRKARIKALEEALRPFVVYAPEACFLGNGKWTPVQTMEAGGGWIGAEDFRRAKAALSPIPTGGDDR